MAKHSETAGASLSHVTIGSNDLKRAKAFYDAALTPLGLENCGVWRIAIAYGPAGFEGANPPFWVMKPIDKAMASVGNGVTVAFDAPSRKSVDAFHVAALAAGGKDEGAPGIRKNYHPNYYGGYVRDLDGNKICAVCHAAE